MRAKMLGVSVSRETLTPNAGYAVAILVRCAQPSLKLSCVPSVRRAQGPGMGRAGCPACGGVPGAGYVRCGARRAACPARGH